MGQRNHSTGREFQSLAVRDKETVDRDIFETNRNSDMQSIRIRSGSPSRIKKGNQLSQFSWPSTTVIPIEKT